jgi:hypothetical protein
VLALRPTLPTPTRTGSRAIVVDRTTAAKTGPAGPSGSLRDPNSLPSSADINSVQQLTDYPT